MRLRHTIGFSLALLVMSGGAMPKPALAEDTSHPAKKHHVTESKAKPTKVAENRHRHRDMTTLRTATRSRRYRHQRGGDVGKPAPRRRPRRSASARSALRRGMADAISVAARPAASGSNSIHNTAAHRTLPLQSLARVTNLDNGPSVIVRVTDRGPVSRDLVIDLSPSAAEALDMKDAGIVPVSVEPVVLSADASP